MKRRLLLLGAPVFQKPVVLKAQEMGLLVGVADINADAPAASCADVFFQGSIKDFDAMLAIVRRFKPDAILSGACDTSVVTVARLCEELGLPGNSVESAINSTDKVAMLEAFARAGVAAPEYRVVRSGNVDDSDLVIPFPVITKPTDSAGGRGINVAYSAGELAAAIEGSSRAGASGDVLVEEFMEGKEVSVEVVVADGVPHVLQVTDKITSGAPHYFEIGHSQPAELSGPDRAAVSDLASRAVLSVGLTNSAAHVEVMLTSDGPKMVELGARVGGDWITSYLIDNSVSGINMVETMIRLAFGETIKDWDYRDSGFSVATKFMPSCEGVLEEISGVDAARRIPGVIHIEITGKIGCRYETAVDDSSRFASVVAKGETREKALAACDSALQMISARMRDSSCSVRIWQ